MSRYMDFDDPANRDAYTGREVDPGWVALFEELVHPKGRVIADVGCGGGIYTRAIAEMGAGLVVGLDFSRLQLESAETYCRGVRHIAFLETDAESIGIAENTFHALVERALIHHLQSVLQNFREARRVLKPSGMLWVQDRTVEDALLPPSNEHIRGYYMIYDQVLRDTETERRRDESEVTETLMEAGFITVDSRKFRELRKVFETPDDLRDEIVTRRGRSLLHKLDDRHLSDLADYVVDQISVWPVHERDTWTVWIAKK
jgi:ubiquinone/menaquinone biosynthesis C-methylase UbiE